MISPPAATASWAAWRLRFGEVARPLFASLPKLATKILVGAASRVPMAVKASRRTTGRRGDRGQEEAMGLMTPSETETGARVATILGPRMPLRVGVRVRNRAICVR